MPCKRWRPRFTAVLFIMIVVGTALAVLAFSVMAGRERSAARKSFDDAYSPHLPGFRALFQTMTLSARSVGDSLSVQSTDASVATVATVRTCGNPCLLP